MTTSTLELSTDRSFQFLKWSSNFWGTAIIAGQLIFVAYISMFYGGAFIRDDMNAWNSVFPRGFVAGETFANAAVFVHIALAALITLGGVFQLLPFIKSRFPVFHRWNGRVYVVSAFFISLAGLIMMLGRGAVGDAIQQIGLGINAILIMVFASMTFITAFRRNFKVHPQWAIRLFLAVSGVWFFRVLLMLWIIGNQGPVGFDPETFRGPFLSFLAFATYLLPLAIHEVYLRSKVSENPTARYIMTISLVIFTLLMIAGIAAATAFMWFPRVV